MSWLSGIAPVGAFFAGAALVGSAGTLAMSDPLHVKYQIASGRTDARAHVTRAMPDNHDTIEYAFQVGEGIYTGSDYAGLNRNPRSADLHSGDPVRIAYDRRDPSISCACDPQSDFNYFVVQLVVLAAGAGLVSALLVILLISRRSHRTNSVGTA